METLVESKIDEEVEKNKRYKTIKGKKKKEKHDHLVETKSVKSEVRRELNCSLQDHNLVPTLIDKVLL